MFPSWRCLNRGLFICCRRLNRKCCGVVAVVVLLALNAPVAAPLAQQQARPDNPMIAVKTATVDGVRLQYLSAGHGPAVVLLHGYAETSRMWRPLMPRLAEHFTVIAPDPPGIGGSGIPANGLA
jgi:alpha-beta hydrolase superfamily lysophospholipase